MNANVMRKAARTGKSGFKRYGREVLEAFRSASRTPRQYRADPTATAWISRLDRNHLAAMWIGHATMLVRIGGVNVLTDPVMGERIGVSLGLGEGSDRRAITFGLSRLVAPAVGIDDLPRIDLVLLSHAHFDHLDRPTLSRLATGPARGATVITAGKTAGLVPQARQGGFGRVIELRWDDAFDLEGRSGLQDGSLPTQSVRIRAIRPRHWGARTAVDHHRACNAYVIESRTHRVLFGGDTAYTDSFKRVGPCDLAILGIGAYEPWSEVHATPEEAWSMCRDVSTGFGYGLLAPMHHSTFRLGDEAAEEPMRRLLAAAGDDAATTSSIVCREIGGVWSDDDLVAAEFAAVRTNARRDTRIRSEQVLLQPA